MLKGASGGFRRQTTAPSAAQLEPEISLVGINERLSRDGTFLRRWRRCVQNFAKRTLRPGSTNAVLGSTQLTHYARDWPAYSSPNWVRHEVINTGRSPARERCGAVPAASGALGPVAQKAQSTGSRFNTSRNYTSAWAYLSPAAEKHRGSEDGGPATPIRCRRSVVVAPDGTGNAVADRSSNLWQTCSRAVDLVLHGELQPHLHRLMTTAGGTEGKTMSRTNESLPLGVARLAA